MRFNIRSHAVKAASIARLFPHPANILPAFEVGLAFRCQPSERRPPARIFAVPKPHDSKTPALHSHNFSKSNAASRYREAIKSPVIPSLLDHLNLRTNLSAVKLACIVHPIRLSMNLNQQQASLNTQKTGT
jgi:hypothetical protein